MSLVYHRGYHKLSIYNFDKPIENTLQAFAKAIDYGATLLECDVRLSKDNKLIIWHDATFSKYSKCKNAKKCISDLKISKINNIKFNNGERALQLKDLLTYINNFKNVKLVIDIKGELTGMILADFLNSYNYFIKKIELVISFNQNALYNFYNKINHNNIKGCWIIATHYYPPEKMCDGQILFNNYDYNGFINNYLNYNLLFQENNIGLYIQYNTCINKEYVNNIRKIMYQCKFKSNILGVWNDICLYPNFDNITHINNMMELFDYINIDKPIITGNENE